MLSFQTVSNTEYGFYGCTKLTDIRVDKDNQKFSSNNGVLFSKNGKELLIFPNGRKGTYTIPFGVTSIGSYAFHNCIGLAEIIIPDSVNDIKEGAFDGCTNITEIIIPSGIKYIESAVFQMCESLTRITIPDSVTSIGIGSFQLCTNLKEITIPRSVIGIGVNAFTKCFNLSDIYYSGNKEQWSKIIISTEGADDGDYSCNRPLLNATVHFKDDPIVLPEEPVQPEVQNPKDELGRLKSNGSFRLEDFQHYLTREQADILERYLFTWLAEVNYAYQYSGSAAVKETVMKRIGIDPQGDFESGMEHAITHISVKTPYGTKTFEITMGIGKSDGSGNLYPGYSVMHYEVLETVGIPSDVPKSGQIVRDTYTDMGPFAESVKKSAEDFLHGTYQWEKLGDEITAGVLTDKNVSEIIGNKNGSFSDGAFTIYGEPLYAYSKIVRISCPVDVHVYSMDGTEVGSIIGGRPDGGNRSVRLDTDGDTKTVYLAGDDYYLNLHGTGTGK